VPARFLALIPALLTAWFARGLWSVATDGPFTVAMEWLPALGVSLAFRFDGLSLLFATLITAIGTLIVIYASRYLEQPSTRFYLTLFAFMGSMLGLVLSDDVIALFVFWELTGFTSYLLIGFEDEREEARRAALQALIVTGAGGLALLAGGVLMTQVGGSSRISVLLERGPDFLGHETYPALVVLILLAAFTKSAQFPFHFWLPNAMQAPTPVSAYLHSATMVKAGVYLAARMTPLLGGSWLWMTLLVSAGALTMVGGAYRATIETDLKRVLAYSTISALGVLMLLLGVGTQAAVTASLVYLLAHACYKGALFMIAGAIDHETGTRDVTEVSGLRHKMPVTAAAGLLAAASMAGLPLFFGFIAKEQFYESLRHIQANDVWPVVLLAAAVGASALLGAVALTAGLGPFIGRLNAPEGTHEAPAAMWFGPLALGVVGLAIGFAPGIAQTPVSLAAAAILPGEAPVTLALWHGLNLTLLLSAATLLAAVCLFLFRVPLRRHAWPRALGTERLYTRALSALDAISDVAAPAFQGASLRSYVLTIVLTFVGLVGTALVTVRLMPALSRWTPIQLHEAAVALLIVLAAVSAARATNIMTAVLSLGMVGYGVSLMYVIFGAPDLGMTQFAVETLTVVIFVLVFRQLRGFGDLSSPLVRLRDGVVATAAGAMIAVLVLFIGASGTTSRLSSYFVDAAPRLGHGRNVVNVILVDFRAFDTLGEITVLVTVAVGVMALLRIAKEGS
jgi:multicomponent Na+:H+ antiporter subunit A